jgi:3-methyl-2-oxobutanoate hydroxymethyltransferase
MPAQDSPKTTIHTLVEKKARGEKIASITGYDFPSALLADRAGMDFVLVCDSASMVVAGRPNTLEATLDEMIYHARAVRRAVARALLVVDMPFGSYQTSEVEAVRNALRLVKEAGAEAVKLEGGRKQAPLVERLVQGEIPVMGHIGLTPQAVHMLGGYRVQGKSVEAGRALLDDAQALVAAGAFAVVLEGIPREIAAWITREIPIPTIGIGAGPDCDGQVLVWHDVLGLNLDHQPKFVRRYANLAGAIEQAIARYIDDVRSGAFPADAESYHLPSAEQEKLQLAKSRAR